MLSMAQCSTPWLSLVTMTWIRNDWGPAGRVPSQIPSIGDALAAVSSWAAAGESVAAAPRTVRAMSAAHRLENRPEDTVHDANNALLAKQHPHMAGGRRNSI